MTDRTNELIERYIYAVTRLLPRKIRRDIEKELRTLISDMLDERCGEVPPTEHDVRAVLTELGTPDELAAKYDPDKFEALIGKKYYRIYKTVLGIVLACVAFGVTLAAIIHSFNTPSPFIAFGEWIGSMIGSLIGGFGIVTLIFAIMERKDVRFSINDGLDSLPELPKKDVEHKTKVENIIGIVISFAFTFIVLVFPNWFCAYSTEAGYISVINPAAMPQIIAPVLALGLVGIAREVVELIEGRFTWKVALASLICGAVSIYGANVLFLQCEFINPALVTFLYDITGFSPDVIPGLIFRNIGLALFAIIAISTIIDIIVNGVKTIKVYVVNKGEAK